VTALLLQHGASGSEANRGGMQPLEMGANQGSWREMHAVLSAQPQVLQELGPPKGRKLAPVDGYAPGARASSASRCRGSEAALALGLAAGAGAAIRLVPACQWQPAAEAARKERRGGQVGRAAVPPHQGAGPRGPTACRCRPAESYLELLLLDVLSSSCTGCLDGSSAWGGCQRCLPHMGSSPHNPRASFYRTIDVLLGHGLQPSAHLLRHLLAVSAPHRAA
jgi:hypothetical protein